MDFNVVKSAATPYRFSVFIKNIMILWNEVSYYDASEV